MPSKTPAVSRPTTLQLEIERARAAVEKNKKVSQDLTSAHERLRDALKKKPNR